MAAPTVQARAAEPAPVPPWEDLPEAVAAPAPAQPAAAPAPVVADDDGPPAWVDEAIPDEAGGGFAPEHSFTADPDDEFETLAPAPAAMPAPRAPTPRRESGGRGRAARSRLADMSPAGWPELVARLPVTGLAAELARQSEWAGVQGDAVLLRVAVRTLAESESRVRLQTVLCEHFGQGLRLEIEVGVTGDGTAHAVAQIERAARQQAAEDAVAVDPFVQALVADFGGRVVPGSIRHVDNPPAA